MEFLTQQRNEAEERAQAEEKKLREEQEKERQKLREAYVREWDIGKEGVDEKIKKFREMSQEEYVEQQRDKRLEEFAPPQTSNKNDSLYTFDPQGRMVSSDSKMEVKKTWSDVRPKVKTPPPPDIGEITTQKGLYFTSSKNAEPVVKYRNFVRAQEPTLIVNELGGNESIGRENVADQDAADPNHAEIAPPPIYEYYGPVPKYSRPNKPFESDIREAYAQGAKSLETKSSHRKLPQHYDFSFD